MGFWAALQYPIIVTRFLWCTLDRMSIWNYPQQSHAWGWPAHVKAKLQNLHRIWLSPSFTVSIAASFACLEHFDRDWPNLETTKWEEVWHLVEEWWRSFHSKLVQNLHCDLLAIWKLPVVHGAEATFPKLSLKVTGCIDNLLVCEQSCTCNRNPIHHFKQQLSNISLEIILIAPALLWACKMGWIRK